MLNCKPEQSSLQTPDMQVIYLSELLQDLTISSSPPHKADTLIAFQSSHRTPHTIITSSSDSNAWDQKQSLDSTTLHLRKYSCQTFFCKAAVLKQRSSRYRWALHQSRDPAKNRFPRQPSLHSKKAEYPAVGSLD